MRETFETVVLTLKMLLLLRSLLVELVSEVADCLHVVEVESVV